MKLDWQKIILNLRNSGLSYEKISQITNIDAQQIGNLARDTVYEPKLSKGILLLDLHFDRCPDRHNLKSLSLYA